MRWRITMAFVYRSKLKRPASLVLAAIAVLGWLLALGIGLLDNRAYAEW